MMTERITELLDAIEQMIPSGGTVALRREVRPDDFAALDELRELLTSATANSVGPQDPDPVGLRESDRQSSESRDLEEALDRISFRVEGDMIVFYLDGARDTNFGFGLHGSQLLDRLTSTTAALPPPESDSSGLGSASALVAEAGEWPRSHARDERLGSGRERSSNECCG